MKALQAGDNVMVVGRRWFDRTYGNTYHSAEVYVNGVIIGREPFQYGYGDQYIQTGRTILEKEYRLPGRQGRPMWTWELRDYGITLASTVSDVARKADL